jgi:hypothetical protein
MDSLARRKHKQNGRSAGKALRHAASPAATSAPLLRPLATVRLPRSCYPTLGYCTPLRPTSPEPPISLSPTRHSAHPQPRFAPTFAWASRWAALVASLCASRSASRTLRTRLPSRRCAQLAAPGKEIGRGIAGLRGWLADGLRLWLRSVPRTLLRARLRAWLRSVPRTPLRSRLRASLRCSLSHSFAAPPLTPNRPPALYSPLVARIAPHRSQTLANRSRSPVTPAHASGAAARASSPASYFYRCGLLAAWIAQPDRSRKRMAEAWVRRYATSPSLPRPPPAAPLPYHIRLVLVSASRKVGSMLLPTRQANGVNWARAHSRAPLRNTPSPNTTGINAAEAHQQGASLSDLYSEFRLQGGGPRCSPPPVVLSEVG